MHIVSVPGRLVRDPATRRPIDEVGIDIDPTDFNWARLIDDGDVAVVESEAEPEAAPAARLAKSATAPSAPAQEA